MEGDLGARRRRSFTCVIRIIHMCDTKYHDRQHRRGKRWSLGNALFWVLQLTFCKLGVSSLFETSEQKENQDIEPLSFCSSGNTLPWKF